ncbi:uncharacterized protein B4U79_04450, partial [Dinothrombium tinctorium]
RYWLRYVPVVIAALTAKVMCIDTTTQTYCASNKFKNDVSIIEENADILIGALLNVHELGSKGLFDCGNITRQGITTYEALEWVIEVINQQNGVINGSPIKDSFIPGVKLGAKVFDTCFHQEMSIRHLTELYPILESGTNTCGSETSPELHTIGVLDATGLSVDSRVTEYSHINFIPLVSLSHTSAIPPDTMGKILAQILHDLEWIQIALIHETDEHSVHVVKLLGQVAMTHKICLNVVESLPTVEETTSSQELRSTALAFNSVTSSIAENTPILVIGNGKSIHKLVDVMLENAEIALKYQWFFASLPDPETIKSLAAKLNEKLFTLATYPASISMFEAFWQNLQSPNKQQRIWFDEFVELTKKCDATSCFNKLLPEGPIDVLWRTHYSLPAIHAVFTFAHALRNAWNDKCKSIPGFCSTLRNLSRKDFVTLYLEPFQFEHNTSHRSPPEIAGRKSEHSRAGEIEGLHLAITNFEFNGKGDVNYKQLIVYDSASDNAKVIDENFKFRSSPCPLTGCQKCVKVRQSRVELIKKDPLINSADEPVETYQVPSEAANIVIPIVLPIHRVGKSPLECSNDINAAAIYDFEAALWMIDQINSDKEFVPGVKFGAIVLDSCSSSLKAIERVSKFLTQKIDSVLGTVSIENALSAITSSSTQEIKPTVQLLSSLNITVVSAQDLTPTGLTLGSSHHRLQTTLTYRHFIHATIEQLKYFDWNYVSLVMTKENEESVAMTNFFKEIAAENGICISTILAIDELDFFASSQSAILNLKQAKDFGAKVVLLMTTFDSTRALITTFNKFVRGGNLHSNEFQWILVRESNLNIVNSLEFEMIGSLALREGQGSIKTFIEYFGQLNPETNTRNPWFKEFWLQTTSCRTDDCLIRQMNPISTINVMQSVLAIISGFARLRNEVCGNQSGICQKLRSKPDIRSRISSYIQFTAAVFTTPVSKDIGEMFSFTKDGFGMKSIDVLNFKKDTSTKFFRFDQVAVYDQVFRKLENRVYVSYDDMGNEMPTEKLKSECILTECSITCHEKNVDFLRIESSDNLYISASIGVHQQSSSNPLQCGPISLSSGIQNLEAFLWALDTVNNHPSILPGVQLGAFILDSCSSHQKTARDVSNFLSNSAVSNQKRNINTPLPKDIVGFIVDSDNVKIVDAVVDVTLPLGIMTIAAHNRNSKYDEPDFSKLLRLVLSNQVYADSIISILLHFGWNFVSVLYEDDKASIINTFNNFKSKSKIFGIEFALEEKIMPQSNINFMTSVVNRLQKKAKLGSHVVILFLNENQIAYLLDAVKKIQNDNQSSYGEFVWLAIDGKDAFHTYPRTSLGALSISPPLSSVPNFRNYFTHLQLRNNSRNPWFGEYWQKIHNCKGITCYENIDPTNIEKSIINDRETLAVINSVFAIAHGMELARRALCPQATKGLCLEMKEHPKLGDVVFDYVKRSVFLGAEGKKVQFSENANYIVGNLNIYNLRHVSSKAAAFLNVGRFNEKEGLFINTSKAVSYNENGDEISFRDIVSRCNDQQKCRHLGGTLSRSDSAPVLQMIPSHSFTIGALLPLHKPGKSFFSCGELDVEMMFQNLIAFNFAIDKINSNKTVLGDTKVGAIAFDYCGRKEKAEEKLFTYLSEANLETIKVPPKSLIALITYSDETASEVDPILSSFKITHLTIPALSSSSFNEAKSNPSSRILRSVPSKYNQIEAIIDILLEFEWKFVNIIYDDLNLKKKFRQKSAASKICVDETIDLSEYDENSTVISQRFGNGFNQKSEAKVIVSLLNSQMNKLMFASLKMDKLQSFVWIGNEDIIEAANEIQIPIKVIAVKVESYSNEEFKKYFSSLSLGHYGAVPMSWFEEFWQTYFKCQLPNSLVVQNQFSAICSGQERIDASQVLENEFVQHTITSILAIAKGTENYLKKHCVPGSLLSSIDDCADNAREILYEEIRNALIDNESSDNEISNTMQTPYGFHVLTKFSNKPFSNSGVWKNGILNLVWKNTLQKELGIDFKSICTTKCSKCWEQFKSEQLTGVKPHMMANFKQPSGMIVSILSGIGVLAVLICGLYFLMVFPISVGTTVLGYTILIGLFILYSINFLFLMPVDFSVCWLRRFGMSLAYSIVISGMLVKVMNTWRLMAFRNARPDELRLTSCCGLVFISGGLIALQIIVTIVWLFLYPPKPVFNDIWSCSQNSSNFVVETESVVSLLYILLLLVITIFFSALTWKSYDNNYEPRYIMFCCSLMGIMWALWSVFSSYLTNSFHLTREMTVICVNLINATVIMIFLFLRKLYIYMKLTRKIRNDRDYKARLQPSSFPGSMYGTVHKTNPIIWESQHTVYSKRSATRPPFESDQVDDNASSCGSTTGSVQVQAQDLYPMEVYDGGSQFQAMSSLFNANSNRSVYLMDESTYIR